MKFLKACIITIGYLFVISIIKSKFNLEISHFAVGYTVAYISIYALNK